jgi:hypothetical protein
MCSLDRRRFPPEGAHLFSGEMIDCGLLTELKGLIRAGALAGTTLTLGAAKRHHLSRHHGKSLFQPDQSLSRISPGSRNEPAATR